MRRGLSSYRGGGPLTSFSHSRASWLHSKEEAPGGGQRLEGGHVIGRGQVRELCEAGPGD